MVPPWGPGVLAQERPKFFSFQTLPGDWRGAGGLYRSSFLLTVLSLDLPSQVPTTPGSHQCQAQCNAEW